jgi:hypothetical protein
MEYAHMEYAMKFLLTSPALGLALAAGATAAQAQIMITQPLEIVQTTETVRTIRPAPALSPRRQIVTTRTITREVVPTTTVFTRTMAATPQPLYDEVTPAPLGSPDDTPALYDTAMPVAPAPGVAAPVAQGMYSEPFIYRYVYEPDRILVIDPNTGIAVQAIPR